MVPAAQTMALLQAPEELALLTFDLWPVLAKLSRAEGDVADRAVNQMLQVRIIIMFFINEHHDLYL
jgi:hypothetical protein